MNKIQTAEEILDKYVSIDKEGNKRRIFNDEPIPAMIEFAKLHVEAALKKASEIAAANTVWGGRNKELILNAYPEENIK